MQRKFDREFAKIIKKIPDAEYDVEIIIRLYGEFVTSIADDYGIVYFKGQETRPGANYTLMHEREIPNVYEAKYNGEINELKYSFSMGNGGHVDIQIGIKKDKEITEELKADIDTLAKSNFLLSGRAQAMNDLGRAMYIDQITDTLNQIGLYKYMADLLEKGTFANYCANFFNIKNMKLINEHFGEKGGNSLLKRYSASIREFLDDAGEIARMGGDNFVAIVETKREEEFLKFIRRIVVEIGTSDESTHQVKVESRVGYYYIESGDDIQKALSGASVAYKYARASANADVILYKDHMKSQILRIKQLEEDVPGALEREEFIVYYQPKASMPDENEFELCGAEALVRWAKDVAIIPPIDFIPLMEKNGMVTELDFYMLDKVCRDIKGWLEVGLEPVKTSINFSRRHLKNEDICSRIFSVIEKHGVDPKYFEIEITETYDNDDMDALSQFEKMMHAYGISVSVDDFGSGFSSIKMIKNIVTDTIKLDKSIIDGIGEANEDNIILSHVISMIRKLGKDVIAEGVETKEQAEFLRQNNCNMIQGFLYGKPMPKEEFEKLLPKNNI